MCIYCSDLPVECVSFSSELCGISDSEIFWPWLLYDFLSYWKRRDNYWWTVWLTVIWIVIPTGRLTDALYSHLRIGNPCLVV